MCHAHVDLIGDFSDLYIPTEQIQTVSTFFLPINEKSKMAATD